MSTEIRTLSEDDLEALVTMRRSTFGYRQILEQDEARERFGPRLPHTRGVFVEGRLASTATVLPFTMHLGGREVAMGGLASVQTPPEARRRGYVAMLIGDAFERLHEMGVGWSLEYPFDPRFYDRYGWQSVANGVQLELPTELLFSGRGPAPVQLERGSDEGLQGIYDRWAGRYNFALTRRDEARESWRRLIRRPWESVERLVYRFDDAYCILEYGARDDESGRQPLEVSDYAFGSPEGRRELFAFLGSFHGQMTSVRIQLPFDDPLLWDHYQRHARAPHPMLQARVVDVTAALEALDAPREGTLVLQLRDEVCRWNEGRFVVVLSPEGVRVKRTRRSPDLTLDCRALTLLLSNSQSAVPIVRAGLITGDPAAAALLQSTVTGCSPFMPFSDFF